MEFNKEWSFLWKKNNQNLYFKSWTAERTIFQSKIIGGKDIFKHQFDKDFLSTNAWNSNSTKQYHGNYDNLYEEGYTIKVSGTECRCTRSPGFSFAIVITSR